MITLHKTDEGIHIADLYDNKSDTSPERIYWHPRKKKELRLGIEDVEPYLNSEEFRNYYQLHPTTAKIIGDALLKGKPLEATITKSVQTKYWNVKKDLEKKLYSEMDLHGSDQYIRLDFPVKKKDWSGLHITIGSSGGGKTYSTVDMILHNLNGPKAQRRLFVYASTELTKDVTLRKLMGDRYRRWVTGIDLSDEAMKSSDRSVEDWFNTDILPIFNSVETGGHIVLDDPKDSPASKYLLRWQNTAYRTVRHKGIGLTSIQHSMRGGRWSSQAYSSVKFVHTFPRGSGKGKLVDYLSKDIGVRLRDAREYVTRFAEHGRRMTIRMHNPSCLIGPKGIVLL